MRDIIDGLKNKLLILEVIQMSDRITLSAAEAAETLGISKTKMYELMKRSDCDFSLMLGGRRLINRSRLEAWIDRQTDAGKTG